MALYQPANGWDGVVAIKTETGSFSDASEIYGIKFDENWNLQTRKQLGVKAHQSMPGIYEATGSATAYFITGAMIAVIYGIDSTADDRDHSERVPQMFSIKVDFADFPITVKEAGVGSPAAEVNLIGYYLQKCLLGSDSFELQDSEYVEKPLEFSITKVIDIYDVDPGAYDYEAV